MGSLFEQKNLRLGLLFLDMIDKMRDRTTVEAIYNFIFIFFAFVSGFAGFNKGLVSAWNFVEKDSWEGEMGVRLVVSFQVFKGSVWTTVYRVTNQSLECRN